MANDTTTPSAKTVIITRAVSGSGKTTLSRCVTETLRAHGLTVSAHSTDDYFMCAGRYVFDINKLNEYHAQNLTAFVNDLSRGVDVIICDNMNLQPWQCQPYTDAARKFHYHILFLNFLPRELEKHLAAQIVTPEKPDAHGIAEDTLKRFIKDFNDYNDLLNPRTVRTPKRHRLMEWDNVNKVPKDTGKLSPYFDADAVITIRPDEYQEIRATLGDCVLKVIAAAAQGAAT